MKDAIFGNSTAVNTVFFAKCRDLAVIFCVFVILYEYLHEYIIFIECKTTTASRARTTLLFIGRIYTVDVTVTNVCIRQA